MSQRYLNLITGTTCDMIKISEEENNFSEISSEREEGILSSGSVADASVTSNAIYNYTELLLLFMLMN
jgi:hypothetical protein